MNLKDHNRFNSDFLDGKHASNSANNVPVLDENAKIPLDQLPTGITKDTVSLGNHKHDDIYYTEEEMDEILTTSETNINTNMNSAISDSKTEVLGNVSNNYVTAKDYNDFKSNISSQISQTETDMDTKISNVSKTVDSLNEQLKNFKGALGNNIQTSGGSINIGSSNSSTDINVNDNGMSFTNNNQEVAYISNQQMTMTDAVIRNSLALGNFKFVPKTTGNTSLVWDDMGNLCYYDTSYWNQTNANYPIGSIYFREKPVHGQLYTIELCASLGPSLNHWTIYNSGGSVNVVDIEHWRFENGVAKKSFIWIDTMVADWDNQTYTADNTYMAIYPMPNIDNRPASTLTYAKLYKGDNLWRDNGNLLRFNNLFDYPKGTKNAGYNLVANRDDYYVYTDMYCYLEAGVEYKFSCEVDGEEGNWGGGTEDTVQAYLVNKDNPNGLIHKEINPTSTFTVDTSTRWWLRLDVNKNGCSHWFSNLWITKVEEV